MEQENTEAELERPYVYVEELTFADGTKIEISPDDIILFVGPNNSGKSRSLREISTKKDDNNNTHIIFKDIKHTLLGNMPSLEKFIKEKFKYIKNNKYYLYDKIFMFFKNNDFKYNLNYNIDIFNNILKTENRIVGSNSVKSIDFEK